MRSALDWLKAERAASDLSIMMVVGLPNSAKSSLINAFKVAAKRQGETQQSSQGLVFVPACLPPAYQGRHHKQW